MRRTEGSRMLLRQPRVRIMALCKVPKGTVARWCSGVRIPQERYRLAMVEIGIPLEAWTRSTYPGVSAPGPTLMSDAP